MTKHAIEAAAEAVYQQRPHQYWDHSEQSRGWVSAAYDQVDQGWRDLAMKQARAAILAWLEAIAQDDDAVESVKKAVENGTDKYYNETAPDFADDSIKFGYIARTVIAVLLSRAKEQKP